MFLVCCFIPAICYIVCSVVFHFYTMPTRRLLATQSMGSVGRPVTNRLLIGPWGEVRRITIGLRTQVQCSTLLCSVCKAAVSPISSEFPEAEFLVTPKFRVLLLILSKTLQIYSSRTFPGPDQTSPDQTCSSKNFFHQHFFLPNKCFTIIFFFKKKCSPKNAKPDQTGLFHPKNIC